MTVGDVLRGPNKEEYAQPRIKYTLRALVHSHEDDVVTMDKEITVLPRSEPSPPINTSDFPREFVDSAVNPISFSRFQHSYSMTMSLQEPSPITLSHPHQHVTSQLMLDVVIRTFGGGAKGPSLQGLPQNLKNLTFSLQPIFRAKTFYSTKPFPQIPSQTMVYPMGPVRLHDSILKLAEQKSEARSWEQQLSDPASLTGKDMDSKPSDFSSAAAQKGTAGVIESWTSHIQFPIQIEHDLSPSFCTAVASRQYSIIGRVRVKGAHVSEFILECPVQVNYSLSAPEPPQYSDRTNGQETNAGRQMCHGRLDGSLDFVIDQDDPPPYSNE
ncbi:hypothetical protein LTR57_024240 [Friedmanniomyces endolithicus]|nr:hypothetical protein LTR57_024240 [Friedmanniomyces endolithicus]